MRSVKYTSWERRCEVVAAKDTIGVYGSFLKPDDLYLNIFSYCFGVQQKDLDAIRDCNGLVDVNLHGFQHILQKGVA